MVGIPSLVESDRAIRADWLNPRSLSRAAWSGTGTRTSRPAALSASASAIAIAQRSDRWVQPRYLSAWAIDSAAPAYRTAATAVRPGGHSRQRPQSAGEPGRGSEQRRHPVARGRRVARHQRQTPGLALGNGSPQWTHNGGRSTSARAPIARGKAMAVARGETRGRNERNGGRATGPRQTSIAAVGARRRRDSLPRQRSGRSEGRELGRDHRQVPLALLAGQDRDQPANPLLRLLHALAHVVRPHEPEVGEL